MLRVDFPWHGPSLAHLYSAFAELLGFRGYGREQRLEALARYYGTGQDDTFRSLLAFEDGQLHVASDWKQRVAKGSSLAELSQAASSFQARLDAILNALLTQVRRLSDESALCLGGSLFTNSHFNATIRTSRIFERVFVPINPGDAGLAVGAALHAGGLGRHTVTPFLGPCYSAEEIKATFDNCKLKYDWVSESDSIDLAVDALSRGQLVAWATGAMEWGPRALGARSILANPFASYVLENLNRFLKRRDYWRGYALSVPGDVIADYFDGPESSPFMECDYLPRDPERFRNILPAPNSAVRVQTVGADAPPLFRELLKRFGDATGTPVLVNTSFNGFREPIVCSARDAVRVFFGTGIDMLIFDQFLIVK